MRAPFDLFFVPGLARGDWPICTTRPSDIDDWVARLSKTMGPQSVRACYGLLRGPLRREVVFDRQVINQNGTHTFAELGSKTGDWRTVPVPQPVMDALTAHIARYRDDAAREELVFTNARNGHIEAGRGMARRSGSRPTASEDPPSLRRRALPP